jgi:hypothetical protein
MAVMSVGKAKTLKLTERHMKGDAQRLRNVNMRESRRIRNDRVSRESAIPPIGEESRVVEAFDVCRGHSAFGADITIDE